MADERQHIVLAVLMAVIAQIVSFQQQLVLLFNLMLRLQQQIMQLALNNNANIANFRHARRRILRGRLWRRPGRTDAWWNNLYEGRLPEDDWKKNFRMTREVFMSLADELRCFLAPKRSPRGADVISVDKQLGMTLYYLKDQGSLAMTANTFGVAIFTLSVVVRRVCAIITRELGTSYIKLPSTDEEMGCLVEKMENKFGFPQAFGCVDGTHIPIRQPSDNAHDFFSYKMKYTLNVQGVCDCNGLFIDVDIRWPGSVHDARVFAHSRINKMLREERLPMRYKRLLPGHDKVPVILLGDPAYPLLPYCMKEYSSTRSNEEVIFNNMLRSARNPIECAYGRLKARWQVLTKKLDIGLKDIPNLVFACFVLHNICETRGMPVDADDMMLQVARDRATQPDMQPDRLYTFTAAEGVHVRNIITMLYKEHLPHTQ